MVQNLGNLFIDGENIIGDASGNNHTISSTNATINSDTKMFGTSSILLSSGGLFKHSKS